jgi:N-acetylglucosaminyldiphosphoundecaprenol N-acetyl-beta-D-mannosaminyltransferase
LFASAALISADGQPLVIASRLLTRWPLPERVATTDLFHDVAAVETSRPLCFAIYGATPRENARAVRAIKARYPHLRVALSSHGFLAESDQRDFVRAASAARADILWVCLGIPREQAFYARWRHELHGIGIVKTGGGLLNFLSGTSLRAPRVMQSVGLEWLFRISMEPKRLFWRYFSTNPHAAWLLLTRTEGTQEGIVPLDVLIHDGKARDVMQPEYRGEQEEPDPVPPIEQGAFEAIKVYTEQPNTQ